MGLLWFLNWDKGFERPTIVSHSGDGGQYLMVMPNHGIVAVRLRDRGDGGERERFGKFGKLVVESFVLQQR
jgi:CubicO group peptidase (beta-lactamase class C family)